MEVNRTIQQLIPYCLALFIGIMYGHLRGQSGDRLEELLAKAQQMEEDLDPTLVRASLGEIELDQGKWLNTVEPRYGGRLLTFDAFMTNEGVALSWATEDEMYSDIFVVERKQKDGTFASITHEKAAGMSRGLRSYRVQDEFPKDGLNVYRLRQKNLNGIEHVSQTIELIYNPKHLLVIQPLDNQQLLSIKTPMNILSISIEDTRGTVVIQTSPVDHFSNTIDIRDLKPGKYLVRIDDGELVREAAFEKKK